MLPVPLPSVARRPHPTITTKVAHEEPDDPSPGQHLLPEVKCIVRLDTQVAKPVAQVPEENGQKWKLLPSSLSHSRTWDERVFSSCTL
jgi:hypothetical protein